MPLGAGFGLPGAVGFKGLQRSLVDPSRGSDDCGLQWRLVFLAITSVVNPAGPSRDRPGLLCPNALTFTDMTFTEYSGKSLWVHLAEDHLVVQRQLDVWSVFQAEEWHELDHRETNLAHLHSVR
jgi:hypothetical protein